eukprot:457188_1
MAEAANHDRKQNTGFRTIKTCRYYNSPQGCKYGDNCKYKHIDKIDRRLFTTIVKSKNRLSKKFDSKKLETLILQCPNNKYYHYEYFLSLRNELNENKIQIALKSINIALQLDRNSTKAWVMQKIIYLIRLYEYNNNSLNVNINDLIHYTENALKLDHYYFYTTYIKLLSITQNEQSMLKALNLYNKIWKSSQHEKYFNLNQSGDYNGYLNCLIHHNYNIYDIAQVVTQAFKCYNKITSKYMKKINDFKIIQQKNKSCQLYVVIMGYIHYLSIEKNWNVTNDIVVNAIELLEFAIEIRCEYYSAYLRLAQCYFVKMKNYNKCKLILQNGIEKTNFKGLLDKLNDFVVDDTDSVHVFKIFAEWAKINVFNGHGKKKNIICDNMEEKNNSDDRNECIQPGQKLNINLL